MLCVMEWEFQNDLRGSWKCRHLYILIDFACLFIDFVNSQCKQHHSVSLMWKFFLFNCLCVCMCVCSWGSNVFFLLLTHIHVSMKRKAFLLRSMQTGSNEVKQYLVTTTPTLFSFQISRKWEDCFANWAGEWLDIPSLGKNVDRLGHNAWQQVTDLIGFV